jgi:hypothetical protein
LALVVFDVAVLQKYLQQSGTRVSRTNPVGRLKASTWSIDFGIAPDEATIHATIGALTQKLPAAELPHWLEYAEGSRFSDNFLKMQASHACIDDGGLREWGEAEGDSLFD